MYHSSKFCIDHIHLSACECHIRIERASTFMIGWSVYVYEWCIGLNVIISCALNDGYLVGCVVNRAFIQARTQQTCVKPSIYLHYKSWFFKSLRWRSHWKKWNTRPPTLSLIPIVLRHFFLQWGHLAVIRQHTITYPFLVCQQAPQNYLQQLH